MRAADQQPDNPPETARMIAPNRLGAIRPTAVPLGNFLDADEDEPCSPTLGVGTVELKDIRSERHVHLGLAAGSSRSRSEMTFSATELEEMWQLEGFEASPSDFARHARAFGVIVPAGAEFRALFGAASAAVALAATLLFAARVLLLEEAARGARGAALGLAVLHGALPAAFGRQVYLNSEPLHALVTFMAGAAALAVAVALLLYGAAGAGALLLLAGIADGLVAFGSLLVAARLRQLQPCNLAQSLDIRAGDQEKGAIDADRLNEWAE